MSTKQVQTSSLFWHDPGCVCRLYTCRATHCDATSHGMSNGNPIADSHFDANCNADID